jgi:hypothetical protein
LAGCFVFGARDARAETFAEILGTPLTRKIGTALAQSIGRGLPLVAESAGFTYRYDPQIGWFVRERSIAGQLFLERPETLPPGRWNLILSYQRVEMSTIEGKALGSLSDTSVPIVDPQTGDAVTIPLFGVNLTTTEITGSLTYGITQNLEVNITVPMIYSDFKLRIVQDEPQRRSTFAQRSTKLGVGDIFLRGKYGLLHDYLGDLALGLVLRLPAGNEDNFQGVGAVEVAPMLYAASGRLPIGDWVHVQGYLNAGLDFDTESFDAGEGREGVGLDCQIGERVVLATAVLARHSFGPITPAGFFDLKRSDGTVRPLFGLQGGRTDIVDFSFGGRVDVWRDRVLAFANVLVPLNRDGVRANAIPTVGIEAIFY